MFRREERGQALVEFAIVLPALLLLILGIVEFAFVWNSRNTVLFASRDGAMLAAEGGNGFGTDCVVLDRIERDIISPSNAIRIQQVQLYWSDRNGDQIGAYTNVLHGRSQAALQSLGFRREGVLRQWHRHGDTVHDVVMWSILRGEYERSALALVRVEVEGEPPSPFVLP